MMAHAPLSRQLHRAAPVRSISHRNRALTTTVRSAAASGAPADAYSRLQGIQVLRATDGSPVDLTQQWGPNEKAVVAWTRSLGCPFCQELSVQLRRDVKPVLDDKGFKLLMVSIGTPERAKDFVARTGFPAEALFLDPDNVTYDALGLKRSVQDTFFNIATPLSLAKRVMESKTGDLAQVLNGWEPWMTPRGPVQALQQGGMLVFQGPNLLFSHVDPATGAHMEVPELLAVAERLASQADCGCPGPASQSA